MTIFTQYRSDGWPLCPNCGEDELQNPYLDTGQEPRPTLEDYLGSELSCLRCDWHSPDQKRYLDLAVAEEVLGWGELHWEGLILRDWTGLWGKPPTIAPRQVVPPWSTRIVFAWEVIEKLRSEGWLTIVKEMPDGFPFYGPDDMDPVPRIFRRAYVSFQWIPRRDQEETRKFISLHPHGGLGDTTPEAICRAALNLREAEARWKEHEYGRQETEYR